MPLNIKNKTSSYMLHDQDMDSIQSLQHFNHLEIYKKTIEEIQKLNEAKYFLDQKLVK